MKEMDSHEQKSTKCELLGQDEINLEPNGKGGWKFSAVACHELSQLILDMKSKHGSDVHTWPAPEGVSHAAVLLREFILKVKGQFVDPYPHEELCHCRSVPAAIVKKAILSGAHTVELVGQITTAGTACGTCRPDTEKLIRFHLVLS